MSSNKSPKSPDVSFGQHYAVLNLDLMTCMVEAVQHHPIGQSFISNCIRWSDAVHAAKARPLTIFTTLCFPSTSTSTISNAPPPFANLLNGFPSFDQGVPGAKIHPDFVKDEESIFLSKNRLYAGAGNKLEEILRLHEIDTVVISGLTLSGVVLSTVYRLFDLDYRVFIIADNVLDLPLGEGDTKQDLAGTVLGKMPLATIITVDQAIEML